MRFHIFEIKAVISRLKARVALHRLEGTFLKRRGIAALIRNKAFRPRFAIYSGAWSTAGGIKPDSANSGGQIRVNLPMMI